MSESASPPNPRPADATGPAPVSDGLPDPAEIRAALDRVVASPGLAKSPQLAHFLSFIVAETLAGRGDQIKAYTIAVDALGRDPSFDPQIDAIVRVEAGRLRRALENYYAGEGRYDPVIVALPIGHYAPVFRRNGARPGFADKAAELRRRLSESLRDNLRLILLIAVVATAVCMTLDLVERIIVPAVSDALRDAPPAASAPDATGRVKR